MGENKKAANPVLKYIVNNIIVFLLLAVAVFVGITRDNFFSMSNFNNLAANTAVRFLIALGVSGCLITKGTDLSAGRATGLCACLAGVLLQRVDYSGRLFPGLPEFNLVTALLVVLLVGGCIGLFNGFIVSVVKVPPFLATLGTQTIVYGIALVFTNASPVGGFKENYTKFCNGKILSFGGFDGITYLMIIAAISGVFFWLLYNKTTHGKYMYAIGGNESAAEVSGVNTVRSKMIIYTLAGVMYGLAGYLLAGKSGGASSGLGMGYELEAIAGATIGGVSTTGGIGTVPGILVGVLVFELLKIVLQFLGVNPYYNYIVQGVVIIVAVALDIRKYLAKK